MSKKETREKLVDIFLTDEVVEKIRKNAEQMLKVRNCEEFSSASCLLNTTRSCNCDECECSKYAEGDYTNTSLTETGIAKLKEILACYPPKPVQYVLPKALSICSCKSHCDLEVPCLECDNLMTLITSENSNMPTYICLKYGGIPEEGGQ